MAGRRIRDEEDARACLAAVEAAGIERGRWAKQHGVDGRSLYAWDRNLRRWTTTPKKTRRSAAADERMVELVAAPPQSPPRYRLHCGSVTLEVEGTFDEDTVARLLKLAVAC